MDEKQKCALKSALNETVKIYVRLASLLAGTVVFILVFVAGLSYVADYIVNYLASAFPVLTQPIPPEFFIYGMILIMFSLIIRVIHLDIRKRYEKHLKKC